MDHGGLTTRLPDVTDPIGVSNANWYVNTLVSQLPHSALTLTFDLDLRASADGHGWTDRRYQTYYLPSFAVDKDTLHCTTLEKELTIAECQVTLVVKPPEKDMTLQGQMKVKWPQH